MRRMKFTRSAIVECCHQARKPGCSREMPLRSATFSSALMNAAVEAVLQPKMSAWRSQRRESQPKTINMYRATTSKISQTETMCHAPDGIMSANHDGASTDAIHFSLALHSPLNKNRLVRMNTM